MINDIENIKNRLVLTLELGEEICQFIQTCYTPIRFTRHATIELLKSGYEHLTEDMDWGDNPQKKVL